MSADKEREQDKRELESGRYDPVTPPTPQDVQPHPTDGETMRFGDAPPGDEPVSIDGVLDPVEAGHPLPEGLERTRKGPLNKSTGRRGTF